MLADAAAANLRALRATSAGCPIGSNIAKNFTFEEDGAPITSTARRSWRVGGLVVVNVSHPRR